MNCNTCRTVGSKLCRSVRPIMPWTRYILGEEIVSSNDRTSISVSQRYRCVLPSAPFKFRIIFDYALLRQKSEEDRHCGDIWTVLPRVLLWSVTNTQGCECESVPARSEGSQEISSWTRFETRTSGIQVKVYSICFKTFRFVLRIRFFGTKIKLKNIFPPILPF
jgi:hypothetical protein